VNETGAVGILSDSHSRVALLENFAGLMRDRGVDLLIHCGDITDIPAVRALRNFEVHWVFGNCDWNQAALETEMRRWGHHCHGIRGEIEIGGKTLAFTHGDRQRLLGSMLLDPRIDLAIHGHTHRRRDEIIDGGRVLCPGAFARVKTPTAVILGIPSLEAEFVEIPEASRVRQSLNGTPR